MPTVVLKEHGCRENGYQDKRYGKGNRLANKTTREKTYRCTVCGKDFKEEFLRR